MLSRLGLKFIGLLLAIATDDGKLEMARRLLALFAVMDRVLQIRRRFARIKQQIPRRRGHDPDIVPINR